MIEVTREMRDAFRAEREDWCDEVGCGRDDCLDERLAAVLAIVERDNYVSPRPTPERIAEIQAQLKPKRRLRACVENWPDAEDGAYDPHCCRWPKSCSAEGYEPDQVTDADLEPER